jgi:hypothetical protein
MNGEGAVRRSAPSWLIAARGVSSEVKQPWEMTVWPAGSRRPADGSDHVTIFRGLSRMPQCRASEGRDGIGRPVWEDVCLDWQQYLQVEGTGPALADQRGGFGTARLDRNCRARM